MFWDAEESHFRILPLFAPIMHLNRSVPILASNVASEKLQVDHLPGHMVLFLLRKPSHHSSLH